MKDLLEVNNRFTKTTTMTHRQSRWEDDYEYNL